MAEVLREEMAGDLVDAKAVNFYFRIMQIRIEVSAHHIHLSQKDIDILFGKNYQFHPIRKLSQADDFAAQETVQITGPKDSLTLRVVGPARTYSQVEIAMTDAIRLGIDAPLKLSGDVADVKQWRVVGPQGETGIPVIIAKRHLHISTAKAQELNLKTGDAVKVKLIGQRALIFENVIVRTKENYHLSCHLDTDEANACGLGKAGGEGELLL